MNNKFFNSLAKSQKLWKRGWLAVSFMTLMLCTVSGFSEKNTNDHPPQKFNTKAIKERNIRLFNGDQQLHKEREEKLYQMRMKRIQKDVYSPKNFSNKNSLYTLLFNRKDHMGCLR